MSQAIKTQREIPATAGNKLPPTAAAGGALLGTGVPVAGLY